MSTTYEFSIASIIKRGALNGIVFALLWASWAYYINRTSGDAAAFRAAVTQASFTIVNAFVYSVLMEYLFSLSNNKTTQFILAWIIPNTLVTVLLVSIHHLRGTPEIFATVAPPLAVVFALSAAYTFLIGPRKMAVLSHAT